MMEIKVDIDVLTADAIYIENALEGLETFLFYKVYDEKVTNKDIDVLNGLVASIKTLATKHANEMAGIPNDGGGEPIEQNN